MPSLIVLGQKQRWKSAWVSASLGSFTAHLRWRWMQGSGIRISGFPGSELSVLQSKDKSARKYARVTQN